MHAGIGYPAEELSKTGDRAIVMLDSGLQQVLGLGLKTFFSHIKDPSRYNQQTRFCFSEYGYPTCFPLIAPSLMIITNY